MGSRLRGNVRLVLCRTHVFLGILTFFFKLSKQFCFIIDSKQIDLIAISTKFVCKIDEKNWQAFILRDIIATYRNSNAGPIAQLVRAEDS